MATVPAGKVEFNDALSYLQAVKAKCSEDVYMQFIEILSNFRKEDSPVTDCLERVNSLFADAPDLLEGFKAFHPKATQDVSGTGQSGANDAQDLKKSKL